MNEIFERNLKPNYLDGRLLLRLMFVCDWRFFSWIINILLENISLKNPYISAVTSLYIFDNPQLHFLISSSWANKLYLKGSQNKINVYKHDRLRIGYFSPNFSNHALTSLIAEIIELHDTNKVELFGFNYSAPANDDVYIRLKPYFKNFFEVHKYTDQEIIDTAIKYEIDIAVNLVGYAGDSTRPNVFSARCAPVQITYMYAGPMALPAIDYILGDRSTIDSELEKYYSEKIIYMPNCYLTTDTKIKPKIYMTRENLNLPDSAFIFASLNAVYKINPRIFDVWLKILEQTENSVLLLTKVTEAVKHNLLEYSKKSNIDPTRIIFQSETNKLQYYSYLSCSNLFLDTFPYNAHTVAIDATWCHLPILTLKGESFASRVGASILTTLEIPELITTDINEYSKRAIELAKNKELYLDIKARVKAGANNSSLLRPDLFVKNLERAYQAIYERKLARLPNENIYL